MGKYTVTNGQNLFDISMHIYGSIEGVVDLMMNNSTLSYASELKAGDQLIYTDDFIINKDIVSYFRMNNITPSNGERQVYYKESIYPLVAFIRISNERNLAAFNISGSGVIEIDWGDNTPIQTINLQYETQRIEHFFNNRIASKRKICLYGYFDIKQVDLTPCDAESVIILSPVYVEKFILKDACIDISFFNLLKDAYDIDLGGLKTTDLLPLLNCKKLLRLNLSDADLPVSVLDNYLIALVKQHYGRRNCIVTLTETPSGEYKEPGRDKNLNYIITSGMEAIWILLNEPAWNEGGYWKFIINGQVYTSEK